MIGRDIIEPLLRRLKALEDAQVRFRKGTVTSVSPLSVALGGATTPYVGVRSLGPVAVGDLVAVLTFGNDLLVLGAIGNGADPWHELGHAGEPALQGVWANQGGGDATAAFRFLASRLVALKGTVTGGANGSAILFLPGDYRPSTDRRIGTVCVDGGALYPARLFISASTGEVDVYAPGTSGAIDQLQLEIILPL